jgi:hypothetical protein
VGGEQREERETSRTAEEQKTEESTVDNAQEKK